MSKIVIRCFSLIAIITCFSATLLSESDDSPISFKWGGLCRLDTFTDTRQCVGSDDNLATLYPKKCEPDANCCDINACGHFGMSPAVSRLWMRAKGPSVGKAELSGYFEMDFVGRYLESFGIPRLRYAFTNAKWPDKNLIIGLYLHPLMDVDVIPDTVGFFAGTPITLYARTPQIRFEYMPHKLAFIGVLYSQFADTDTGPIGADFSYIQDSMLPGFYVGTEWRSETVLLGAGLDIHRIRPALSVTPTTTTTPKFVSDAQLTSLIGTIYTRLIPTDDIVIKAGATYGQNGFSALAIGGYAVNRFCCKSGQSSYSTLTVPCSYTNLNFGSIWLDADYVRYQYILPGFFVGVTQSTGASKNKCIYINSSTGNPIFYGYDSQLDRVFRFAPRIRGLFDKFELGLEFDYTVAWFGCMNARGKHPCTYSTSNARVLFVTTYKF